MRKSELFLLIASLVIGLFISLVALFYFIKPSNIHISDTVLPEDDTREAINHDDSWINKISNQNQEFSYPTVIYKLEL